MLVLTRQTSERIMVGENIVITVVRIGPNNVRIGISCPREMRIVREELNGGNEWMPRNSATSQDGPDIE